MFTLETEYLNIELHFFTGESPISTFIADVVIHSFCGHVPILGRVLLELFRNRNTWNRRYLCSFGRYSVFGMNRMEGIRFTRNRQNTRSFGKFLAGNPMRPLSPMAPGRHGSSQVTSAMGIPFPDLGAFF